MTLREQALEALRTHGPMTAFQLAQTLGWERPSRALYAALDTAVRRSQIACSRVEATHFHSFQGGESKLFSVIDHDGAES